MIIGLKLCDPTKYGSHEPLYLFIGIPSICPINEIIMYSQ